MSSSTVAQSCKLELNALKHIADSNWDRFRFVLRIFISVLLLPVAVIILLADHIANYTDVLKIIGLFVGVFAYRLYRDMVKSRQRSLAAMNDYIDAAISHNDNLHPNTVPESAYYLFKDKVTYPQVRTGKQIADCLKTDYDKELRAHYVALRDNIHLFLDKNSIY